MITITLMTQAGEFVHRFDANSPAPAGSAIPGVVRFKGRVFAYAHREREDGFVFKETYEIEAHPAGGTQ